MKIKCAITDDEPLARRGLEQYASTIDFLEVAGLCEDALQLNTLIQEKAIDLIFLDINMPHLSGIDFLKVRTNKQPKVILTTAYAEYALEGYELDVLDYLLKPISFERFFKAATKAKDFFNLAKATQSNSDYFFLKCNKRLEKIEPANILFVESMQNYIRIITSEETLTAHTTLKSIKGQLSEDLFLQPHKSYLVAIDKIKAIEGNQMIIGPHKIPISKYLKEAVLEKVVNSRLFKK